MTSANHRRIAGELAEMIYGSFGDEYAWQAISDRFCELIPGTKTIILATDNRANRDFPLTYTGFDDHKILDFAAYYGNINPWTSFNIKLPLLTPVRTEDGLPASSFRESEFYADFLSKLGGSDAGTGFKIWGDGERSAQFAVHYAVRDNARLSVMVDPVLRILGPVMNDALSALRIRFVNERAGQRAGLVGSMVDPAYVITRTGKVLAANAAGQSLANDGEVLRIGVGDQLEILEPLAAGAIRSAIAAVVGGRSLSAGQETARIGPPARLHSVALYPLTPNLGDGFRLIAPGEACLLLIARPLLQAAPSQVLREQFGLTAAEVRLALRLVAGSTLQQVSSELGISYLTTRTQLRSIFAKLNVNRQVELVALLLSVLGHG